MKNHNLGLEVPYLYGSTPRAYIPDFIVQVDDGHDEPLNLIVEIKGYRGEDAKEKKSTMEAYWLPGVNAMGQYGRWAFAEFTDVYDIQSGFDALMTRLMEQQQNSGLQSYEVLNSRDLLAVAPPNESEAAGWLANAGGSEPQIEDIPRRRSETPN